MTQEHPRKLTLTVEESVWLNKGQEIDEILGMSLSPEITIKEDGDQVSIVGGLRLVGEYTLSDTSQEEEPDTIDSSYRDQASFRSIEEVHVSENGKGDLKHFFPVDVTIPLSRIQNLQDIYVEVESFDYDVPDKSCIQLTADISISGMSDSEEQDGQVQPIAEEEEIREEQAIDTSFSFEAYQLPTPSQTSPEDRIEVELDREGEKADVDVGYSDLHRITLAPHADVTTQTKETLHHEEAQFSSEESEEDSDEEHQHSEREENALYLTSMMSKSEEQFTKWRMCIIQEHESLDSIAQRYDVSTSQLIRMNRLDAEQVEAGQILYIPVQS
ncbi:stage VI sporulation protein D [Alkalicoccobacillus porphyridii]|uniref:Stage VI sporulation protein D n=1 Tax=Alkalicoccobacillus porphyridii TaxID=2597270 RepID=A0A553ZY18_9BACI|nr:stage VI sporulation protein D [Alkalicoccobacillus porphyridii]TSB46256.1 stage VI sporulation protein D [Alkalicoccobacillus porphyridii]